MLGILFDGQNVTRRTNKGSFGWNDGCTPHSVKATGYIVDAGYVVFHLFIVGGSESHPRNLEMVTHMMRRLTKRN